VKEISWMDQILPIFVMVQTTNAQAAFSQDRENQSNTSQSHAAKASRTQLPAVPARVFRKVRSRVTRTCSIQGICCVTKHENRDEMRCIKQLALNKTISSTFAHPLPNTCPKTIKPWHYQPPKTPTRSHQQAPSPPHQPQTSLSNPLQNTTTLSHYKHY
jgi:hypothetical protein